jgi:hypothetical protein
MYKNVIFILNILRKKILLILLFDLLMFQREIIFQRLLRLPCGIYSLMSLLHEIFVCTDVSCLGSLGLNSR